MVVIVSVVVVVTSPGVIVETVVDSVVVGCGVVVSDTVVVDTIKEIHGSQYCYRE